VSELTAAVASQLHKGWTPSEIATWSTAAAAAVAILGRAFHALVSGGGIRGIMLGLWCGTNTPITDAPGGVQVNPNAGKKAGVIIAFLCLGASLGIIVATATGCAGVVNTAQKTESAMTSLADGAMKGWAAYYKSATNNPEAFHTTLETLEAQRMQVDTLARNIGADLAAVDGFISAYQTNSATEPALQAAIDASAADAAGLASVIAQITGKTNLANVVK
jgi:hypothetical protein